MRFLDLMGLFSHDVNLCLREFSKSLTDRAYTWYVNLKPGSVRNWEHLMSMFNAKSFYAKARFPSLSSTIYASVWRKIWTRT